MGKARKEEKGSSATDFRGCKALGDIYSLVGIKTDKGMTNSP